MADPANNNLTLSPVQNAAKPFLTKGLKVSPILVLGSETGRGKTTILAEPEKTLLAELYRYLLTMT